MSSTGRALGAALIAALAPLSWIPAPAVAQSGGAPLPAGVTEIMSAPKYKGAVWGLRTVDAETGAPLATLGPDTLFFTGSVRKLFSVGTALNALGSEHRFVSPVYAIGPVTDGVLEGDLVLVAGGDLTLGGRDLPDGTVAFTNFDHTEANSLGSAILTETDPLAGITALARRVAGAGVREVAGEVVVDDRLFEKFRVPNGDVLITPVIVNDNLIDVTILPTEPGEPAAVDWRPKSAGFTVRSEVMTVAEGEAAEVTLEATPEGGLVKGAIPVGYTPSLPGVPTLVRTFTIPDPSAYLRTVFIEALAAAGVTVKAAPVGPNPAERLPAAYPDEGKLAELVSLPYAQYARLILKVSHNLGANLSLMLHGLTKGARTRDAALAAERQALVDEYGLPADGFDFPTNGSGSPDSRATPEALTGLLLAMRETKGFDAYFAALPGLGVDGSLATVGRDPLDPVMEPAFGRVYAKTGTTISEGELKAQAFAGYIDAKSGARLAYVVYVNGVKPIESIADVIKVFGDQGEISALLYEAN